MNELKPCPFCGGKANFKFRNDAVFVRCDICEAQAKLYNASVDWCAKNEAAKAWNRRAENG